jgi:DNA-binding IclR family transcriptional regulator
MPSKSATNLNPGAAPSGKPRKPLLAAAEGPEPEAAQTPEPAELEATPVAARAGGGSQTVDRALGLLKLVAVAPTGGLRLLDITTASGLDRATTYRLLASLAAHDFIEQDAVSKRYTLGLEFFTLAAAASNRFDLAGKARVALERLSASSGDTASHYLRSSLNLVCMDVETGHFPIKTLPMDIGSHRPIGAGAAGIAYLSALSDMEIHEILKKNARRLAKIAGQEPDAIWAAIAEARRKGFALAPDEPAGRIVGLAIALIGRHGRPLGTLSLNGIPDRFSPDRIAGLFAMLTEQARFLADSIGLMPDTDRHRSKWEGARRRKGP